MSALPRSFRRALAVVSLLLAGCGADPVPTPDSGATPPSCVAGAQGCECAAASKCGKTSQGETLLCQGGLCEQMACPAGSTGCVCRSGSACDGAGDTCQAGFCIAAGCVPGAKSCTCLAGSCDVGLSCLAGSVCVDSTGYEGGACLGDGRCFRGNRCDAATATCIYCDPGTAACACTAAGGCNAGLACANDVCTAANQLPPRNPVCFTSCSGPVVTDAGTLACDTDHLRSGCAEGLSCTQGSCLLPGEAKPSCTTDLQCPPFQACLSGGCYSNCEVNADCATGQGCSKHVCRATCVTTQTASCPAGSGCVNNDGQNGFCVASPSGAGAPTSLPEGGLRVPVSFLSLSNVAPQGSFAVVPHSLQVQDVTVRKLWHQVTFADGHTERVDLKLDAETRQYKDCDVQLGECPLAWLTLSAPSGAAVPDPTIAFRLLPGCVDTVTSPDAAAVNQPDGGHATPCPKVAVGNAGGLANAVHWEGALEITSRDATTTVTLGYVQRPEGQWAGSMYYFGTFGTNGLKPWIAGTDKTAVTTVENGLIQRWGALRLGNLEGWQEFQAVMTATRTESWKFGTVNTRCRSLNGNSSTVACYPYTNTTGLRPYVQNVNSAPIPSGVTELPVAMNLKISDTDPTAFEGRIVSSMAMHYPGNPAMKMKFAGSPADASACFNGGGTDCLVFLQSMPPVPADTNQIVSKIGGRYYPNGAACAVGFLPMEEPWLVPGFVAGTQVSSTGVRTRTVCRQVDLPFDINVNSTLSALNQSLTGGNPVPDGTSRTRTLRFLDGALVNQTELFILFEESFASFIPGQEPTTAYGFMVLKRAAASLTAADYVGLQPSTLNRPSPIALGASCDPSLLAAIPNSATDKVNLVKVLLNGSGASASFTPVLPANAHYLCEDTGFFDGGPGDNAAGTGTRTACPVGSKVTWFVTSFPVWNNACQTTLQADGRGTCFATLKAFIANNQLVDASPSVQCTDTTQVYCDDNRLDLRAGKTLFAHVASSTARGFVALPTLINTAFRYKTKFVSSSSAGTLGFAPQKCVPNSDAIPYCYDPAQIEEARQRIDCLLNLYSDDALMVSTGMTTAQGPGLPTVASALQTFLQRDFSSFTPTYDGFERLYAELLIMQGDDSLTAAYASRFDIAAAGGASFKGSVFEPGGIDLTGVAGAELYRLYEAGQYYQLALDRLYLLGTNMQKALSRGAVGSDPDFITPETVTSYLERLVRAASQKSVAWAQVAKRYQNFNRPDLARRVVERAYVATYLESALISRLMLNISAQSAQSNLASINVTIEKAQRNYRMALLDMREVYGKITDQTNYFGFPTDYIPFPALDNASVTTNAYDTLAVVVRQRLDLAKTREQTALTFGKQGRVDAAQFQSDLVSIRNNYENQLASVCGTFVGDDTLVYPAITKYAPQASLPTQMGDPCGRMGNGELHNAMAAVKDSGLKLQGVLQHHQNTLNDIDIERTRAAAACGVSNALADFQYSQSGTVYDMQQEIEKQKALNTSIAAGVQAVMTGMQIADCEIQCASSGAMAVVATAAGIAAAGTQYATDVNIANKERAMRDYDRDSVKMATNSACMLTNVDSTARIAALYNDTLESQLETLRADYGLRLAVAEVQRLNNSAQRLQAQQTETEQLAINVAAAQNDPNVRIYQNDAVINADVSFNDALAMAYRLTRVYEYYTSQSYSKKEQLFLIRMVTAGQYNLENYLLELDNAFFAFEEQYGNPDVRVMALSLKDDILKIPTLDAQGHSVPEGERIKQMQARLKDVRMLDASGYLTIPFSTSGSSLSPLTRDHKIQHLEVDVQGGKLGDPVLRVYLRMSGTGVVRNVNNETDYYVFPTRLAVVNASVQGAKVYDPDVYRNYRFRDRPLVNTMWELVINQRDELANKDLDVGTLSDVRVLVYYTDFTSF